MDTTLISEIEYINILPDMDMDDSSFLKGSFVNSQVPNLNQQKPERSEDKSQISEE